MSREFQARLSSRLREDADMDSPGPFAVFWMQYHVPQRSDCDTLDEAWSFVSHLEDSGSGSPDEIAHWDPSDDGAWDLWYRYTAKGWRKTRRMAPPVPALDWVTASDEEPLFGPGDVHPIGEQFRDVGAER